MKPVKEDISEGSVPIQTTKMERLGCDRAYIWKASSHVAVVPLYLVVASKYMGPVLRYIIGKCFDKICLKMQQYFSH